VITRVLGFVSRIDSVSIIDSDIKLGFVVFASKCDFDTEKLCLKS